jgi:hypothetical protein
MGGLAMYNITNLPAYKTVFYQNHPQSGYYTKTEKQPEKTPAMGLPYELKVEPIQLDQIECNPIQIIRGRDIFKSGVFKFFIGLQATNFKHWKTGNHCKKEKGLSRYLFHFSNDNTLLTVFYLDRFHFDNQEARDRLINDIIPIVNKRTQQLNAMVKA